MMQKFLRFAVLVIVLALLLGAASVVADGSAPDVPGPLVAVVQVDDAGNRVAVVQADAGDLPDLPGEADLTPVIDELVGRARDFVVSRPVLAGFFVFLLTQLGKWVFPDRVIKTETIYGVVVLGFTAIFMVGQIFGFGDVIERAADFGTVLANTALTLLGMLTVPSISYQVGQRLRNPLAGGRQGSRAFRLDPVPPRPLG